MIEQFTSKLSDKKRYLQIALNSTLDEAFRIIRQLPKSDRIIVEAGTPLIKRYGGEGIRRIKEYYTMHLLGYSAKATSLPAGSSFSDFLKLLTGFKTAPKKNVTQKLIENLPFHPYVVADLKMVDRGETEVEIAAEAGASAAVALGNAPIESLNSFIKKCEELSLDSMIDMMNVEFPLAILHKLKKQPRVVILHRGVDEERFNKEKQIPLHEIRRIKGTYNILIAIAGGDTIREVQRSIFNDADIVVVWKSFYQSTKETAKLATDFLAEIK
jgi:bifunctional enzyme Fae/Hps